ncbi:hypothetical protein ACFTTN_33050 [Streptomyces niveus]|uniref:hypothetical protein n=1 Tax=Streptomyces niveus TaxID=193462 RepID=UPI00363936FD
MDVFDLLCQFGAHAPRLERVAEGAAAGWRLAQSGLIDILITATDETDSLRQVKAELASAASRLLDRIRPAPSLTGENLLKLLCALIHAINEQRADRQPAAIDAYIGVLRAGLTLSPAS